MHTHTPPTEGRMYLSGAKPLRRHGLLWGGQLAVGVELGDVLGRAADAGRRPGGGRRGGGGSGRLRVDLGDVAGGLAPALGGRGLAVGGRGAAALAGLGVHLDEVGPVLAGGAGSAHAGLVDAWGGDAVGGLGHVGARQPGWALGGRPVQLGSGHGGAGRRHGRRGRLRPVAGGDRPWG